MENMIIVLDDAKTGGARWEVRTGFAGYWENCWTENDGAPVTFPTEAAARAELAEHLAEMDAAGMEYDAADFAVVQVGAPDPAEPSAVE